MCFPPTHPSLEISSIGVPIDQFTQFIKSKSWIVRYLNRYRTIQDLDLINCVNWSIGTPIEEISKEG